MDDNLQMLIRLVCAAGAGALLGMERESHGRAAGLRTTILVTMAPCLGMILSGHFYAGSYAGVQGTGAWHPDPMRLAAGFLTGMGFIGAGTILRQGNMVRGVTTAAVLWLATPIGMAFGAGCFMLGATGLLLALATLFLLPYLESHIANDWYSILTLKSGSGSVPLDAVHAVLARHNVKTKKIELSCSRDRNEESVTLYLKHKRGLEMELPGQLRDELLAVPDIQHFDWR